MLASHQGLGSFLNKPAPGLEETIIPTPSNNDLAAAFDEDSDVVIGDANHSVLKMLSNTLNEVPGVSLRESTAEGEEPIARPKSPEMPTGDSDSRYQLQGEIARGGMGAIIKGRDTDLGRDLAIKVLLDSHKDKPEVIQRFVEEAQIGGQLQHPGIVPIYELGQFADKRPFFAMKLVKGKTLSKLLADRDDAAEERGKLIGIFEQICQTMAYAHSRGVIHRDLKPANIMVGAFGEVQVMDWGLAKVLQSGGVADEKTSKTLQQGQSIIQTMRSGVGSDSPGTFGSVGSETQMGSVMGTPAYMPPEQALGEIDQMDERADVFGLGAILCEILTGQPPYVADDTAQVYRMASRGKLEAAFSRLGDCGADEDLIVTTKHCLELEPVDRPRDAGVLADRVTMYMESVEEKLREAEVQRAAEAARADAEAAQATAEGARADAESARASEESKRRRTSLMLATSVLMLVGLGGGGWLYMERQEANRQSAEADAQRTHTIEMRTLAEQREDQRMAAESARNAAEIAQGQADTEKRNSLNMLADMQTERGLLAGREGQSARAALWFANAAVLTPHDLDRKRANHLRASSWLDKAIAPAAFLKVPKNGVIKRFEFQPNGPLLFAVKGKTLRVWHWRNENVLPWSETRQNVSDAVWSPDGQHLAVGFGTAEVLILDPFSGNVVKQFRHSESVNVLEWSPDGTRLAVGGLHVQIWNVLDDEPVQESDWPHPRKVYGLCFNHAGTRLVTSGNDKFARVFAVGDATLSAPIYAPVDHLAFRPEVHRKARFFDNDRKLATITPGWERLVLRDAATGLPIVSDATSSNPIAFAGLAVSPDSRWVAAGSQAASLLAADGRTIELKHSHQLTNAQFSPDGHSLLTTCWDGTARLWPLHDMTSTTPTVGTPITIPQMGTVAQCVFSPDAACLAISSNQQLVIWKRSPSELVVGQVAWTEPHWRPRLSFDGQFVTPGIRQNGTEQSGPRGGRLLVARMADGQPAGPPIKLNGLLRESSLCADNRSVAAATVDGPTGRLAVYDIASGGLVMPSITLPDLPISVAARPQHAQVAVLCRHGQLLVIDTERVKILLDISHNPAKWLNLPSRVAYSPDGSTLLAVIAEDVNPNQLVFVRDVQTGELRFPPLQPVLEMGPLRAFAFSPDSRLLATAVNGINMVQVWDLTTGKKVGREMPHTGDWVGLFSVAFSPDGKRILTGHKDGRARLWDWQTGQLTGTPMTHPGPVYDAQFTPDGRHVVTAVRHAPPQVWNVATGKPAIPFPQVLPAGASSNALAITGDRVVVEARNRYSIVDLSLLQKKPTNELTTLLQRAELAANRKLQLGELVPLEQAEWKARWEQLTAARPTLEEMAQSLARESDEAETQAAHRAIARRAIQSDLTGRLQRLRSSDPHLQIALALEFFGAGRQSEFKRILPKAMADAQETLQKMPTDDSLRRGLNDLASILADQLLSESVDTTHWTVVTPTEMKSAGGADLTLLEDGSILTSGKNPDRDTYTLVVRPAITQIRAIRLEAVPDSSFKNSGSGRSIRSGNFHLNEMKVFSNADSVNLSSAVASFQETNLEGDEARHAIDGKVDGRRGWSISNGEGDPQWLVASLKLDLAANDELRIELHCSTGQWLKQNLGRFRLSISNDPNAYADTRIRFAAMKAADPWAKLVIAYHSIGDQQSVDRLINQRSQAAVAIADLKVASGDWPQAIDAYSKLITDETTDVTLLSKRAAAYIAMQQWELAGADWRRASELQPDLLRKACNTFRNAEQWSTAADFAQQLVDQDRGDSSRWVQLAPAVVFSVDEARYAKFCQSILKAPLSTHRPAERAIKVCLLRAGVVDISELPVKTLATALDQETAAASFRPWGWATRALLAYRSGDAELAVKYVAKSEANQPVGFTQAMNQAILAMANHKLDQPDEANAALQKASKLITTLSKDLSQKGVHHLPVAEILLREAQRKINGKNDSADEPSATPENAGTPPGEDSRQLRN